MEIIKVFSEVDTDERLYSVLMGEEELRVFSKFMKKITEDVEPDEGVDEKKYYRKSVGHAIGAGINGYLTKDLAKSYLKNKNKIAGLGAVVVGGNTLYHTSEAVRDVKKARKSKKKN